MAKRRRFRHLSWNDRLRIEAFLKCGKSVQEIADEIGVQITSSGVKDIILPGDVKAILNEVLLAGKRAEANVITRREEVASTRSLLNTAKLMDENQTLYKLKELEYVQKICEQVGNISISNQGDILSQLQNLIKP